ncbi:hypothetical protein C8A01DRAFT_41944 [Parachaetomium inaequale]|uniref:Uncharacterized protein n=1 Tax=Parachaetomium inaequale TaxID=2588326 RepID=A0AAN6P4I1_9PEZI|nr:hypothetical protein C8A01DRAFT_41944 [Parachaetomium inaequale]
MPTDIQGEGLHIAHDALAALAENPELLDRARARFSETPRYYPSYRSLLGSPTQPPSPDRRSEAQKRRERKRIEIKFEQEASMVFRQFDDQTCEELERLYCQPGYQRPPGVEGFDGHAHLNVKTRWTEQGIWREGYDLQWPVQRLWKHEELPSGCEASEERERDAPRPYHQFVYHVSKERERIQDELNPKTQPPGHGNFGRFGPPPAADSAARAQEGPVAVPPDINTTAYERVKSLWIKRNIWNVKWGVLPGMAWKHERPFDEMLEEALAAETPTKAPTAPQAISTAEMLENAISPPNSAAGGVRSPGGFGEDAKKRLAELDKALFDTLRGVSNNGVGTLKMPDTLDTGSVALGPVHSSKVSKRGKVGRPAPQRRRAVALESGSLAGPPRRSKRLQALRDSKSAATARGLR